MAPSVALSAVNVRGASALQMSATADGMRQLVRDNPPGVLRDINGEKLAAMGVDESLATAFLDNYRFNPLEETLLVGALDAMPKVRGRELMVANASLAASETSARFNRVIAQMMSAFYANVDDSISIVDAGGAIGLKRRGGALVLLAPVDYLFWTESVERNLVLLDNEIAAGGRFSGKELWLSGGMDAAAVEQFAARGWKVQQNVRERLLPEAVIVGE
jgi:hypothetical protein